MNIEQKNTLFVVTLLTVVLTSVAVLAYLLINLHIRNEVSEKFINAHDTYVGMQKHIFNNLLSTSDRLSSDPYLITSILTKDILTIGSLLDELVVKNRTDLASIYLTDSSKGFIGKSRHERMSSTEILNSNEFKPYLDLIASGQESTFGIVVTHDIIFRVVAHPVMDPLGGRIGTLLLADEMDAGEMNEVSKVINSEIVYVKDNKVLGSSLGLIRNIPDVVSLVKNHEVKNHQFVGQDYFTRTYQVLGRPSGDVATYITLALSRDKEWGPYEELSRNAFYMSILILLIAALVGIYISRFWLARPIKVLARAAHAIGKGNLSVQVEESRKDELGDLAQSFNLMLSQLKESQKEEALTKERIHTFAESSSDWLWETDMHGQFTYVSASVFSTIGYNAEVLLGKTFSQFFHNDNTAEINNLMQPNDLRHLPFSDEELWVTSAEGIRLCLRLNGVPYFKDDKFLGYRGTARNITKVKTDEERLVRLANKDHLSGLSNRRRFIEDFTREIMVAERQNQTGALLLLDLDHFKLVNDTAGHAAGDEVIVQVAGLLRRMSRNTDLIARLSGDEFVIAFLNTDPSQVSNRADEIVKQFSQLKPTYGGKILNTSVSVGVAIFPEQGNSAAELLAKADMAMYKAKQLGRNRAYLYSEDEQSLEIMDSQLAWKERIHAAIEEDLLVLAYQPIVSIKDGTVARYEVLVRMKKEGEGVHMPGSFIPTAEQFGLIQQVDKIIVKKAINVLARLSGTEPVINFTINLSGMSVGDPAMMDLIEEQLINTAVDSKRITFEVTESAACQDIGRAEAFISRIQQMGCKVALDDFGVGFSSFSYLKHLRADILKIDGSFVRDIHNNRDDQLFVKALVDVCKGMGMQTVAEFVENEECLNMIQTLGVDYAQGYHLGKPVIGLFDEAN